MENLNNIEIFILFCSDSVKEKIPELNQCYKKIDLRNIWEETGTPWNGDGDFFKSDIKINKDYIGVLSGRYNQKYPTLQTTLEDVHSLNMQENIVWTPSLIKETNGLNWYDYATSNHPGIEKYIDEVLLQEEIDKNEAVVYTQSFICHKDVFLDWQKYWEKWFYKFNKDTPLDYYHFPEHKNQYSGALMERITSIYFSTRKDLIIKQIP